MAMTDHLDDVAIKRLKRLPHLTYFVAAAKYNGQTPDKNINRDSILRRHESSTCVTCSEECHFLE